MNGKKFSQKPALISWAIVIAGKWLIKFCRYGKEVLWYSQENLDALRIDRRHLNGISITQFPFYIFKKPTFF
jgi:hypothetical protein